MEIGISESNHKFKSIEWFNSLDLERKKSYLKRIRNILYFYSLERGSIRISSSHIEKLFQILDSLEECYPNQWDLLIKYTTDETVIVLPYIIFNNVTISNSEDKSLDIKDLIVALDMSHYCQVLGLIGGRLTLSFEEWVSNYRHSHLNACNNQNIYIRDFCLGNSEISDLITQLKRDFDVDRFKLLLYSLRTYVSWESLEGVPYMRLSNVGVSLKHNARLASFIYSDHTSKIEKIFNRFNKKIIDSINLEYQKDRFVVGESKEFEKHILDIIKSNPSNFPENFLGQVKDDGYFYFLSGNARSAAVDSQKYYEDYYRPSTKFIIFRGQKLYFTVNPPNTNYNDIIDKLELNPKIYEFIKRYIENKIKLQSITTIAVKRYCETANNG